MRRKTVKGTPPITKFYVHKPETFYVDSNCQKCKLHKTRTKMCIGRGPNPADVLAIGITPGRTEDSEGLVFIGQSGIFLENKMIPYALELMHMKRSPTIFFTNTVLCRGTDAINGENRNPEDDETSMCRPNILKIIRKIKPKVIIYFGNFPHDQFKDKFPKGIKVWHPSAFLQSGQSKNQNFTSQCRILGEALWKAQSLADRNK